LRAQRLEFLPLCAELGNLPMDAAFLSGELVDDPLLLLLRNLARLGDSFRFFFKMPALRLKRNAGFISVFPSRIHRCRVSRHNLLALRDVGFASGEIRLGGSQLRFTLCAVCLPCFLRARQLLLRLLARDEAIVQLVLPLGNLARGSLLVLRHLLGACGQLLGLRDKPGLLLVELLGRVSLLTRPAFLRNGQLALRGFKLVALGLSPTHLLAGAREAREKRFLQLHERLRGLGALGVERLFRLIEFPRLFPQIGFPVIESLNGSRPLLLPRSAVGIALLLDR